MSQKQIHTGTHTHTNTPANPNHLCQQAGTDCSLWPACSNAAQTAACFQAMAAGNSQPACEALSVVLNRLLTLSLLMFSISAASDECRFKQDVHTGFCSFRFLTEGVTSEPLATMTDSLALLQEDGRVREASASQKSSSYSGSLTLGLSTLSRPTVVRMCKPFHSGWKFKSL